MDVVDLVTSPHFAGRLLQANEQMIHEHRHYAYKRTHWSYDILLKMIYPEDFIFTVFIIGTKFFREWLTTLSQPRFSPVAELHC